MVPRLFVNRPNRRRSDTNRPSIFFCGHKHFLELIGNAVRAWHTVECYALVTDAYFCIEQDIARRRDIAFGAVTEAPLLDF